MTELKYTIPSISDAIKSSVVKQRVVLKRGQWRRELSQEESITWGLLAIEYNTIEQIQYQFNDLHSALSAEQNYATVIQHIEDFSASGLLSFHYLEPIGYPLDISAYSHLFSSRGGLYAVGKQGYKRLAYGMYFGLCATQDNALMAFEFPHKTSSLWRTTFSSAKKIQPDCSRIVIIDVNSAKVESLTTAHSNITNNCHHLVSFESSLYGVDTERQSIFTISPTAKHNRIAVLGNNYHHINSLAKADSQWLLMKCMESGGDHNSSVAIFDLDWNHISTIPLNGQRAHDILLLNPQAETLSFWYCDSKWNHIRHHPSGQSIQIEDVADSLKSVRGLSESQTDWVVGSGQYGRYYSHLESPKLLGKISFINKQNAQQRTVIDVPELACCIIENPHFNEAN